MLRIEGFNQKALDAFIKGDIELVYNFDIVTLQCYGLPDLLVTYEGIICDKGTQFYCKYQDGFENSKDSNESSTLENDVANICPVNYNLDFSDDRTESYLILTVHDLVTKD